MKDKLLLLSLIIILFLSLGVVSANDSNQTLEEPLQDETIGMGNEIISNEDIFVEVDNVFKGYENTIKVSIPNATGSVNVSVGEKTYTPEIVDGVAVQKITDYQDGLNNVLIKYNNLSKTSSFKVLNGIVNKETFFDYFDQSRNGALFNYIPEGVTLDFQGTISSIELNTRLNMTINKAINLISSTKNAIIDFNTTAGSLLGENPGDRVTINRQGSRTNVTGITFHNTQLWLFNTHYVTLDNISVIVEDQRVGSGVGATSIRANSTWVTVKNSYFYTRNNGGSSSLVLAWADYCTFNNNTHKVDGMVGNLVYLTTYNVQIPTDVIANCHNNITNNRLVGPSNAANICYGICISGEDNLVENNTVNYSNGAGIMQQWGDAAWGYDLVPKNNVYRNNVLIGCSMAVTSNALVYNNTVSNGMRLLSNAIAYNNTVGGELEITEDNVVCYNNTMGSLAISGKNARVYDNIINGDITIERKGENASVYNNSFNGDILIKEDKATISYMNVGNIEISANCATINDCTINDVSISGSSNSIEKSIVNTITSKGSNTKISNCVVDKIDISGSNTLVNNSNILSSLDVKKSASNSIISYNNLTHSLVVESNGNSIVGNNITSNEKYAIYLKLCNNNVVSKNYLLTSNSFANDAVSHNGNNKVEDNYPLAPIVEIYVLDVIVGFDDTIMINMVDVTGSIVVKVDNNVYTMDLVDGKANKTISNLSIGAHEVTVDYIDDKSPITSHNSTVFNVLSSIRLSDLEHVFNNGVDFKATLIGEDLAPLRNVKVNVIVDGVNHEIETNQNGVLIFNSKLSIGEHLISVVNPLSSEKVDGIVKVLSRFTSNSNVIMNYLDGSKYSVRVLGDDGKPVGANQIVSISIAGKSVNVNTDANGYATLTITQLPKTYIITATYKGQSISNTVKVNQNLKTSKVIVKKSAKSFTLKATLSKVKGKKITFKFNKKTYAAKTDKNGVAKVTLKKNVIKKLKKGKKYTFTVTYVSNIISNKVIVK